MNLIQKLKFTFTIVIFLITLDCLGQAEWKNWDGINLDFSLSRKLGIGMSHLRSYIITDSFRNNFNQWGLDFDFRITSRFTATTGYRLTQYPLNSISTNRFQIRGGYRTPIGRKLNWTNSLQAEMHSASEERFDYRIIYMTRLGISKRLNFLNLSPSVSYWLYYNIGGKAIQYFDDSGLPADLHSPDGLHRSRLIISLNSKISDNVSLTAYFIDQSEFNLLGSDMNILNPVSGRIARPFDNYRVAGLTFSLYFDLYSRSNRKKDS